MNVEEEEIKMEVEEVWSEDKCLSPPSPSPSPDYLDDFAIKPQPYSDEEKDSIGMEEEVRLEKEEDWKRRDGYPRQTVSKRASSTPLKKQEKVEYKQCFFCTKKSSKTGPKFDGKWVKILGYGFEMDGKVQVYCSPCQELLNNLSQFCKELEEIQSRISDLKGRIESRILNSYTSLNPTFEPTQTRRKSRTQTKERNIETVKRILLERLDLDIFTFKRNKKRDVGGGNNNSTTATATPILQKMPINEELKEDFEHSPFPSPSSDKSWQDDGDRLTCSEGQSSTSQSDNDSDFEISKRKKGSKVIKKIRKGIKEDKDKEIIPRRIPKDKKATGARNKGGLNKGKGEKGQENSSLEKTVRCDRCARTFIDEIRKNAHIKRFHEGISKGFSCDQPNCTKNFKSFVEWESHKLSHTGETPFYCEVCGKGFKIQAHLNSHQKKIHFPEALKFKCDECDKAYAFNCDLKVHKKSHSKIGDVYTCEICGSSYARLQTLNVHMKARHSGKNPFSCKVEDCGREFSSKLALTDHVYSHTKDWPFFCSECGVGASTKARLDVHTRRKHGAGFECEICHRRLTYKTSLQVHMLQHKERQFECDECGKKCYDKYTLETHKSIHGGGDKIFPCEFCDKIYFNNPYLRKHMKSNHKPEYYQRMEERLSRSRHVKFVDRGNATKSSKSQNKSKSKKISIRKSQIPERQLVQTEYPVNSSASHQPISISNNNVNVVVVPPPPLLSTILNNSYGGVSHPQIPNPSIYNSYPDNNNITTNTSLQPGFLNFQNL